MAGRAPVAYSLSVRVMAYGRENQDATSSGTFSGVPGGSDMSIRTGHWAWRTVQHIPHHTDRRRVVTARSGRKGRDAALEELQKRYKTRTETPSIP